VQSAFISGKVLISDVGDFFPPLPPLPLCFKGVGFLNLDFLAILAFLAISSVSSVVQAFSPAVHTCYPAKA
jgi:hypothetical protein